MKAITAALAAAAAAAYLTAAALTTPPLPPVDPQPGYPYHVQAKLERHHEALYER